MKNLLQKIALTLYRTVDATGFTYNIIKDLNVYIRYIYYILFPISLFFTISMIGSLIDLSAYYSTNPKFVIIVILLGKLGLYVATFVSSLIFVHTAGVFGSLAGNHSEGFVK